MTDDSSDGAGAEPVAGSSPSSTSSPADGDGGDAATGGGSVGGDRAATDGGGGGALTSTAAPVDAYLLRHLLGKLRALSSLPPADRQYSVAFVPFIHAVLADGEQAVEQAAWASHDAAWAALAAEYRAFFAASAELAPLLQPNAARQRLDARSPPRR